MFWEDENNIFSSFDSDDKFYEYAEDVICTLFSQPKSDTYDFDMKIAIDYVYVVLVILFFESTSASPVDIWELDDYLNEFEETKENFLSLRKYSTQRILIDTHCKENLFDILDDGYDYRALCRDIGFRFDAWISGMTDFVSYVYLS